MYPVSQEYIDAMNKTCRDASQFQIQFDIVNADIERTANVSHYTSFITLWSEPEKIIRKTTQSRQFATFEKDSLKADGNQYIYDFNSSLSSKLKNNGGFELDLLSDDYGYIPEDEEENRFINISLGGTYNLDYLTLYFDIFNTGDFVTEFSIAGYRNNVEVKRVNLNNDKAICVVSKLGFTNIDSIRIILRRMNRANIRARLWEVRFGLIYIYTNNELLKVSPYDEIDPTSSKLPDQHITFSIDNANQGFNPENPEGLTQYLMENQQITAKIGIQTANGIEWIPVGNYYLSEWDTLRKVEFKGVSKIDTLNENNMAFKNYYINLLQIQYAVSYIVGTFYKDGYSLLELMTTIASAENLIINQNNVTDLTTHTLPLDLSAKEIIQLIAQALGCTLVKPRNKDILNLHQLRNTKKPVYKFDFNNSQVPEGFSSPKLKQIKVKIYKYIMENTDSELWKFTVDESGDYTTSSVLGELFYDLSVETNFDTTYGTNFDYNTKTVSTRAITSTGGNYLSYQGRRVNVIEDWYIVDISDTGDVLEIDNPFCTTQQIAKRIADNYEYWFKQRLNFDILNRGEPALDCGDDTTAQTEFSDNVNSNLIKNSYDWENGAIRNAKSTVKVGGT